MEEQKALDAHYAFEFNGVRMDPYRIMSVYKNIKHPAHQHAVKKLLRAGESVKSLEQDIDETIMTLKRWKEMIAEEREVASLAGVAEAPPNLNSMAAIRKYFGFPDPSEILKEDEEPLNFSGKEIVEWMSKYPPMDMRSGGLIPSHKSPSVFGGFDGGAAFCGGMDPLYCTDFNKHTAPILTAHDPEETLESADHYLGLLTGYGVITRNEAAGLAGRPLSDDPEDDVLKFGDAGATNRLKPVEDKAEIWITGVKGNDPNDLLLDKNEVRESLCPAYIREHFNPKNLADSDEKGVPDEDAIQKFWDDFCKPNRAY